MTTRRQQSPIDLRDPIRTAYGAEQLRIHWTSDVRGTIVRDREHGVKIEFGGDQRQRITLDQTDFHLVSFHFHHPSEHWIAGQQQVVELHVVHQNVRDGNRAVLGIFIDLELPTKAKARAKRVGPEVDMINTIDEMLIEIDLGSFDPSKPRKVVSTNPRAYLPDDTAHYYRYEGSLTTPDFDENVSWVVFNTIRRVPKRLLDEMIRLFAHSARLPQPLDRRFVLANFP